MSKADKMFEELGYINDSDNWLDDWCVFKGGYGYVQFIPNTKEIRVPLTDYDITQLSFKLYIAIHEKMKELGWLENE